MKHTDGLRRGIQEGLAKAKLNHSTLSIELGRSKDYIGDFLRGNKETLGHKEITAIRSRIADAITGDLPGAAINRTVLPDNPHIHIELAAFREALFALLRTLNVTPVLARSRIDDLLADLRLLSAGQHHPASVASLHIDAGSEGQATSERDDSANDR